MEYYIDYEYLSNKLNSFYDNKYVLLKLSKDAHICLLKLKQIFHHQNNFSQNDIISIKNLLNLNNEEVIKCFFTYKETFNTKKDLLEYIKNN